VLVNAIYFLGNWEKPFNPDRTRPEPFYRTASDVQDVPTMHRATEFRVSQEDGVTAVELPYRGLELSMLLLIPDEIEGLTAIEAGLDAEKLDRLISALAFERILLALPRFELEPAESLALGQPLSDLGMPLAFDQARADFSGMADPRNPIDSLYIAKVFHKGFVRVDEKGTEAAAATAVIMAGRGGPVAPPREIKADRPFLFLIRDTATGLVLFLGRVSDPAQK
jgi:serpin B